LVNIGTYGANDEEVNVCGVSTGHAYSLHHAFTIKDSDDTEHKIVMIRNPWGVESGYKDEWGP
jgi:hypothetical protein